ncbi:MULTISPECIES: hypothetical protein [unclassified Curtobacterium]|uniref:hypothetical protein n=1 Tax=unclassified Curtobacterium TaxID=257496 RepID=UPI0011B3D299|nr:MULTISPECIES: hypothetical protein [unclassified Curtobacterium]
MPSDPTADYRAESGELPQVYRLAAAVTVDKTLRRLMSSRHAYMIASGGAAPAAAIAAKLHSDNGASAEVVSPLAFIERRALPTDSIAVVFSARARHPDSSMAVSHALAHGLHVVLLTTRSPSELAAPFNSFRVHVITVPTARPKDGFLATGSVLSMSTVVARAYESTLPPTLSLPALPELTSEGPLVVLYGSGGYPAALDIQIRYEELGLAPVELADYRNFAHGRHVGLQRRASHAAVLALITPEVEAIAERTLRTVPSAIRIVRIRTTTPGVAGSLQLLAAAMQTPTLRAAAQNLALSKPPVPAFGRELYHLPFKRLFPTPEDNPVTRKARAIGTTSSDALPLVRVAYDRWRLWVGRQRFTTIVLDYDGTCVDTTARYELPRAEIRDALLQLLQNGLQLAFASGRGSSLYTALQAWVPEHLRSQVQLGLHNGAWEQALDAPLTPPKDESAWVQEVCASLAAFVELGAIVVRQGHQQVGVEPAGNGASVAAARSIVNSVVELLDAPVQVVSSGHSVDVVAADSGKAPFLRKLQQRSGAALAVGDQGAPGGNDFALLTATKLSVSVDRCSPALDRCWPLGRSGQRGPDALLDVVGMLHTSNGVTRLVPPKVKNGT